MSKEELLKEIMKLPKIETKNPISAMNSINVDDLMSAIDRLNKIPDYNGLLKENQKLKKQVEDTITSYTEEHNLRHNFDLKLDVLETQQKEFINYLEDEIQQQETVIAENQEKLYFFKYEDEKEDLKLSSQRAYIRRIILEEILQKYKSIIGDYK